MTSTELQSLYSPVSSTLCALPEKEEDCRVVVNGAGSAGVAITKLLLTYGFTHVTMCDRLGIIGKDYPNLNWMRQKMTEVTNLENAKGTLADALKGADIFVGVSAPNIVTAEMVSSMNKDSILLPWQILFLRLCLMWQRRRCQSGRYRKK